MRKRVVAGIVSSGVILLGMIGSASSQSPQSSSDLNAVQPAKASSTTVKKSIPTCDGTTVTADCTADGIVYTTYIYHAAVAEKSHTETATTYTQNVTGYCTLCNDGTYSPSCATGRGACSHHGGVAQWNAPIYTNTPEYSTKTVVDTPAQQAYYEKVAQ